MFHPYRTTKRIHHVLAALALFVAIGLEASSPAIAHQPADIPANDIAKPGELPDVIIGRADAPILIVEYASLTCGHCARFHRDVLPVLKEKYIDTGKARLVIRDFPLDDLAAAAAMVARCAGPMRSNFAFNTLLEQQQSWMGGADPVKQLFMIAQQIGFTEQMFTKCVGDQSLLDKIAAERTRATGKFGVNSTPTFFINGRALEGVGTIFDFDAIMLPMLEKQ